VREFHVDPSFADTYPVGTVITTDVLGEAKNVRVMSRSKGKGFQ
jgi:ribosomal protein L3